MPRPLEHLSDEELRQALRAMPDRTPARRLTGWGAVVQWALEYGVYPGRTQALEVEDLYRHFLAAGYSLGICHAPWWEFGTHLTRLGLQRGRDRKGGGTSACVF